MGSYSAPSFALGYHKALNDVTTTQNEILIGPLRCVDFYGIVQNSAIYDGDIYIDMQLNDDSWFPWVHFNASFSQWQVESPQALGMIQQNSDIKYPYVARFRVETVPTLGVSTLHVITQPGPGNTLF